MNLQTRLRLSFMMFLQYFIWSAWYVTMGPYLAGKLNATGAEIGVAYNSTALAAMISPFFIGMVADRFFSTEKILGVLHLLGGVALYGVSQATTFKYFYPLLILHTLCYMPTLALTNSISFAQMTDPGKEFPSLRVLGTISWIVAGLAIGALPGTMETSTAVPFLIASGISILMGVYCFSLPHTPPKSTGKVTARDILGLDALALMKERSFAIFVIAALLICIPLTFYFSFTGTFLNDLNVQNIPGKMSMGQMSEIFFMLIIPLLFARLGVKWMLIIAMCTWAGRYLLFMQGYNSGLMWPLYMGIILHGICYDFFFVTAYIYVDKKAPESIRAKAQGFIAFIMLGAGMFLGANLSGVVVEKYSLPNIEPAKFAAMTPEQWSTSAFAKFDEAGKPVFSKIISINKEAGTAELDVLAKTGQKFEPTGTRVTKPLTDLSRPLPAWNKVWQLPAVLALIIMVAFAVMFQYRETPPATKPEEKTKAAA